MYHTATHSYTRSYFHSRIASKITYKNKMQTQHTGHHPHATSRFKAQQVSLKATAASSMFTAY